MKQEKLETRVGHQTIAILLNFLEEYIQTHTINNKYVGEQHYLQIYEQYLEYQKN